MHTPKALVWQAVRDRNESKNEKDGGFEATYESLITSLKTLTEELEDFRNSEIVSVRQVHEARERIGKALAYSHLAHYRVASEYSFMTPEYDDICDELFGTNYSAEIIEKEEKVEEIFDDMEF